MFQPTPYKISTITATGGINCNIVNLDALYESVEVIDHLDPTQTGFVFIEYGQKRGDVYCKGFHKKMLITRRKRKEGKRFDNQTTVIIRCTNSSTNMKVFKNGKVQMTGLKDGEQGRQAIKYMIDHIKNKNEAHKIIVGMELEDLGIMDYRIRLINSDFRAGIEIRRDKLHKILQHEYANIFSSYEPCIYPGVKIQFNFNAFNANNASGVCNCSGKCNGKGGGTGNGLCKKITIAVFQSGCVIITGAQSTQQIDLAYTFICDILKNNAHVILKTITASGT